ncbi:MAG: DUF1385 domain-containing protein [Ruminococcaceae bacterium]|nr:DUF1385 domain-containing protein [Oscillospiraceae bacterium]
MSKDNNCVPACRKKTSIGGQALIEGIMMRGPKKSAMAVRHCSGEMVLEEVDSNMKKPAKIWRLPLFRGIYGMVTSFTLGYKCLTRSAVLSGMDEQIEMDEAESIEKKAIKKENKVRAKKGEAPVSEEEAAERIRAAREKALSGEELTEEEKEKQKSSSNALMNVAMVIGSVLGVVLAIGLFMYLPSQIFSLIFNKGLGIEPSTTYGYRTLQSGFEGVLKIAIFVGYMALVALMKDIKRTFMYHGAEHKTIFCYEAGLPLTTENVRKMSRFHPRCGTSFMIVMLIISILIGILIPSFGSGIVANLLRAVIKLLLLPLSVGLGYEFIKYAGRHDNVFIRILSAPGLWMQRISTKEPDDSMIECAIAALEAVIPEDDSDAL